MNDIAKRKLMEEQTTALEGIATAIEGVTLNNEEQVYIPADALAADVWERAIFKAPSDVTIKDVIVVPDSDIGQATNYMTLDVQDKGADGAGTTSIGLLAINSTNTIEGMVGRDLVTTNADVTSARVLSLKKTKTGDGQLWPGGLVIVKYTKV